MKILYFVCLIIHQLSSSPDAPSPDPTSSFYSPKNLILLKGGLGHQYHSQMQNLPLPPALPDPVCIVWIQSPSKKFDSIRLQPKLPKSIRDILKEAQIASNYSSYHPYDFSQKFEVTLDGRNVSLDYEVPVPPEVADKKKSKNLLISLEVPELRESRPPTLRSSFQHFQRRYSPYPSRTRATPSFSSSDDGNGNETETDI